MNPPIATVKDPDASQLDAAWLDFHPPLLRIQQSPPNPLGRRILWVLASLLGFVLAWSYFGRLDIVAVADGKLIPESHLKILQPPEAGIVRQLHVREGDRVQSGQVLMRMDTALNDADTKALEAEFQRKRLTLARIEAELADTPLDLGQASELSIAAEIEAQFQANRAALAAAQAEESSRLSRARMEQAAAEQTLRKLEEVLPHYRLQEEAFTRLTQQGFSGELMVSEKRRERIEKEQELATQRHIVASAQAVVAESGNKLAQIHADYRRALHAERQEVLTHLDRLTEERAKLAHRRGLLELRAPQDGIVKDLATHTAGTVVQPGTVLATIVPQDETLKAEVWVNNDDIGFVRKGQAVKIKLAAFPFQKYGMLTGHVERISADASERNHPGGLTPAEGVAPGVASHPAYKVIVALDSGHLEMNGKEFAVTVGMQAVSEIRLGERSVIEYLLSPVRQAWHDAARER